jgi:ATP-dependent Clp protease ATP-binding subunit ClpA
MFERFSEDGRLAIVRAQGEARQLGHGYLGTEHILLGISGSQGLGARALSRLGFDREAARAELRRMIGAGPDLASDEEALRAIGIDLDEVRRRIEAAFGPGALDRVSTPARRGFRRRRRCETELGSVPIPFTPRAKRSIQLSLREATRLGHRHIGTEHLLLGLVRRQVVAVELLRAQGLEPQRVRTAVLEAIDEGDDGGGCSLVGT